MLCKLLHARTKLASHTAQPGAARIQWWVGYILGANANYLSKGPGFLDPRYAGTRLAAQTAGFALRRDRCVTAQRACSMQGGCSKVCRAQAAPVNHVSMFSLVAALLRIMNGDKQC